jgi:subtilisin family serine protease
MRSLLACTLALAASALLPAALPAGAAELPAEAAALPAADQIDDHKLLVMLRLPPPHYRPDASYGGRYNDDNGRTARRRTATDLARAHGLTLLDDWPMPVLGVDCYVMRYADDASAERVLAQLARDPRVEWAQQVALFDGMGDTAAPRPPTSAFNASTTSSSGSSDNLYPTQPAAQLWHLAELHRLTTGRNVSVAVIDSGIDASHPDLAQQLSVSENFVGSGAAPAELHGTAIAGIIAARAGNGGIIGVAPEARLMALRACWQQPDRSTRCSSFTLGKAINYAIQHGAKVINLSLSGPPDRLLDRLIDIALERGITVVGAIDPQASGATFPASHAGVLAVAAASTSPAAAGANTPRGALLAPGRDIPTTAPGARWQFVNGSSYAAAHVSGMAALLAQLQPDASPARLRTLLTPSDSANAGTIDACNSIARITRTSLPATSACAPSCGCSCACIAAASPQVHSTVP